MKFQNTVRNEFNKCDTPDNTLKRIRDGFATLGCDPVYEPVRVTETLFWGRIWIDALRIICEGKGVSARLAEASAHAELAERFSAGLYYPVFEEQVRFHLPAIYSRRTNDFLNYAWMPGYTRARQEEMDRPLTIDALLAGQPHLNAKTIEDIKGCEMAGHWVDGYSLLKDQTVKVPIKFAAYIHGSNGVAAGNTLEEALIQASCEVLERYVQISVIKNETIVPTIDPATIDDPRIREMIEFFRRSNVQVTIKDLSGNGTLPVIGVLFTNHNLSPDRMEYHTLIAGASFSPEEALTRCFTEGVQGRETLASPRKAFDRPVIAGDRVKDYYSLMKCGVSPKNISFLLQGETVRFQRRPGGKNLMEEIDALQQLVARLKTDCIVMDLTHPVLRFPVVRVIIPGISDFLNYLPPDILSNPKTSPATAWRGGAYKTIMDSFFR
ncbi:MAG: YcaO-like family protein [Thermodesulfobacteriota bacterium]